GKLDLVVGGSTSFPIGVSCGYFSCGYTYSSAGYVNVLLGNGAGSLTYVDDDPSTPDLNAHTLGTNRVPSAVAVAELNHDGRADVVAANYYGGLSTLLGDGAGDLQSPIQSPGATSLASLSLGDLDGDGSLDTVGRSNNSLVVQKGQPDGSFVQGVVVDT